MTLSIEIKSFFVKYKNIFLLTSAWALCLILPHYQAQFNLLMIIGQVIISLILFYSINKSLESTIRFEKILKPNMFILFPLFYLVSIITNLLGKDNLYIFLNRFGAGSMFKGEKIYMYGDLAHLTTASSCNESVQIGKNLCDPFNRLFNQNPHIVDFLRIIHFSSTFLLGLASTLLFFILILVLARKNQVDTLTLILILLSPPIVLAIDRGNEIITTLFLLPSLYLITKHKMIQTFGAILLALSVLFKLWPIIILVLLLFLFWKKLNIYSKFIMVMPLIYWIYFHENAFKMVEYTQEGSPMGLSFGLIYYYNSTIKILFVIFFCTLVTFISGIFFLKSGLASHNLYNYSNDLIILNTLFFTYLMTWTFGDNFIYRLIIFIPIIIFLKKAIKEDLPRVALESAIIMTMLTSRLLITTVFTSSLAVIFFVILSFQSVIFFKKRFVPMTRT